jgi:hypothetical protein
MAVWAGLAQAGPGGSRFSLKTRGGARGSLEACRLVRLWGATAGSRSAAEEIRGWEAWYG